MIIEFIIKVSSIDPFSQGMVNKIDLLSDKNEIILLRHAESLINPKVHPELWELTEEGKFQANYLIKDSRLQSVDVIYSSPEQKAIKTVVPLSHHLKVPIIELPGLKEVYLDRFYDDKEVFSAMKSLKFSDPNFELGESHDHALERISSLINGITNYNQNKTILLVTHGTLMAIFLGYYYNLTIEETIAFWQNIDYCHLEFL